MITLHTPRGLAPESLPLLASQIDEHSIDATLRQMQNWYSFDEEGLLNYRGDLIVRKDFSAFAPFLGRSFYMDRHHSTSKRLLRKLIRWRIVPVTDTPAGFDVLLAAGSKRNRAYLHLSVRSGLFFTIIYAEGIDEAVLERVQVLGAVLGKVIQECRPQGAYEI